MRTTDVSNLLAISIRYGFSLLFLCCCFFMHAQEIQVSPWQMHLGMGIIDIDYDQEISGNPAAYEHSSIPAQEDNEWTVAPVDEDGKILFGGEGTSVLTNCHRQLDFTYFQIIIDIPENTELEEVLVKFALVDDGARAYVFNSNYLEGTFLEGGDIQIGDSPVTGDIKELMIIGEKNRVVIVQFDDCPGGNNLRGAEVVINGTVVETCDDADDDGVCDADDNCPGISNTDQADSDGDGVGDVCDAPDVDATVLNFDGVDDEVNLGSFSFYQGDFTAEGWINTTDTQNGASILNVRENNTTGINVEIGSNGSLRVVIRNAPASSGGISLFSTTTVADGDWHHFAIVKQDDDKIYMYIDGVLENSSTNTVRDFEDAIYEIVLGINVPTNTRYYDGQLDEVRFWNVARTVDQIQDKKDCELDGGEDGLVAYYNFNQGIAAGDNEGVTTLVDGTGNGHDGNLLNFALMGESSNWLSGGLEGKCEIEVECSSLEVTAEDDSFSTTQGQSLTFSATTLLANDVSSDGSALEVQDLMVVDPSQGAVTDNGDGTFSFTPADDFAGEAVLTYVAKSEDESLFFSGNGSFYEFITAPDILWTDAKVAAETKTLNGLTGYLATVTSQEENDFIAQKLRGQGWLGASDAEQEGVWKWVTGPEAGMEFWTGDASGVATDGTYNNWNTGEPNDYRGEDYGHFLTNGTWNDYPLNGTGLIEGYVVEYGHPDCPPTFTDEASVIITVESIVGSCAAPIAINCGDNVNGNTADGFSVFQGNNSEFVYQLDLTEETEVELQLMNLIADVDLYIFTKCDPNDGNFIHVSNNGETESENITATLDIGTYYILVLGYEGAQSTFDLSVRCEATCTDSDDDGICDEEDNCPDIANADQADTDGDGVGDVCDDEPYNCSPDLTIENAVWDYGYGAVGGEFTQFTTPYDDGRYIGKTFSSNTGLGVYQATTERIVFNELYTLTEGDFGMWPSSETASKVKFTAPFDGIYSVSANWTAIYENADITSVYIYTNAAATGSITDVNAAGFKEIYNANLYGFTSSVTLTRRVRLEQGDLIYFEIDAGTDGTPEFFPAKICVEPVPNALYADADGNGYPDDLEVFNTNQNQVTFEINTTEKRGIHVFPNPTSEMLNIRGTYEATTNYQIIDLLGKSVQTGRLNDGQIDVNSLPIGTYHLVVENETIVPIRFVKL